MIVIFQMLNSYMGLWLLYEIVKFCILSPLIFPSSFIRLNIIYMLMSPKFVLQGQISSQKFMLWGTTTYGDVSPWKPNSHLSLNTSKKTKTKTSSSIFFPSQVIAKRWFQTYNPKPWVILDMLLFTQSTFNLVGFMFKIFPESEHFSPTQVQTLFLPVLML